MFKDTHGMTLYVNALWDVTHIIKTHPNREAFYQLKQKLEKCLVHYKDPSLKTASCLKNALCAPPW